MICMMVCSGLNWWLVLDMVNHNRKIQDHNQLTNNTRDLPKSRVPCWLRKCLRGERQVLHLYGQPRIYVLTLCSRQQVLFFAGFLYVFHHLVHGLLPCFSGHDIGHEFWVLCSVSLSHSCSRLHVCFQCVLPAAFIFFQREFSFFFYFWKYVFPISFLWSVLFLFLYFSVSVCRCISIFLCIFYICMKSLCSPSPLANGGQIHRAHHRMTLLDRG